MKKVLTIVLLGLSTYSFSQGTSAKHFSTKYFIAPKLDSVKGFLEYWKVNEVHKEKDANGNRQSPTVESVMKQQSKAIAICENGDLTKIVKILVDGKEFDLTRKHEFIAISDLGVF